ncbi:MAG TPA: hypothetical protein DEB09_02680 [Candidatus Magasanikbacteria bacterium]|nr:hypothetical protein [Candidatus Magasanikbacteria bacterium]
MFIKKQLNFFNNLKYMTEELRHPAEVVIDDEDRIQATEKNMDNLVDETIDDLRNGLDYNLPSDVHDFGRVSYWDKFHEAAKGLFPEGHPVVRESERIKDVLEESLKIGGPGVRRQTFDDFKDLVNRSKEQMVRDDLAEVG